MLPVKTYAGREPVNDYEELCQEIVASSPDNLWMIGDNARRQLTLAWLACADPGAISDAFLEAMDHITPREKAELLYNVVLRTDHGRFAERVSGALEVALIPVFLCDINAWSDNSK